MTTNRCKGFFVYYQKILENQAQRITDIYQNQIKLKKDMKNLQNLQKREKRNSARYRINSSKYYNKLINTSQKSKNFSTDSKQRYYNK